MHCRAAAEQGDRAVGVDGGEVAGHRPAHAVGIGREGGRGLGLVLVVAERDVAAAGEAADLRPGATGRRSSSSTFSSGLTVKRRAPPSALMPPGTHLRRAVAVHHLDVRDLGLDRLLHRRREHATAGAHAVEAGEVALTVGVGEGVGQRAGHGVADDGEAHAPLALDDVPDLVGVEAALGVEDHAGAGEEHVAHAPLGGAVHERRHDHARAGEVLGRAPLLPISSGAVEGAAGPTTRAAEKMSSWRHITPLGMPVVPPV